MDFGIVSRSVVNADVLNLHRTEIELSGTPRVLVTTSRASVIIGGNEESILALLIDDRSGDTSHELKRIVPTRRLKLAIAPNERIGQSLQLRVALL